MFSVRRAPVEAERKTRKSCSHPDSTKIVILGRTSRFLCFFCFAKVCTSSTRISEEAFWAFRVRADTLTHQHFHPVPITAAPRSEAEAPMHHGQGFESDSALSKRPRAHSLEFWTRPQELTRGMFLLSHLQKTGWSSCWAIRDCGCQCLRQWASLATNTMLRHRACSGLQRTAP